MPDPTVNEGAPRVGRRPAESASRGGAFHGGRSGGSPSRGGASRDGGASESETVYGLRAGLSVLQVRHDDVRGLAFSSRGGGEVEAAVRRAEEQGVPCAELSDHELERLAGSPHHEGLVVTTRPRSWASPRQLTEVLVASKGTAIALDRVRNPYNIGAILRSAAFFGVDAVILGALAPTPDLAPNAVRVAEGGAERVLLCRTPDLGETLSRMKSRGVRVVGADAHTDRSAFGHRFGRPSVLVMGHEREGMTERVRAACDELVRIPGSGAVESLNVSVAAGVLIAELVRDARRG